MSARTTGRVVGALVLLAFLLYGGGTSLTASAAPGDAGLARLGALLVLANSVAVVGIGAVVHPVLWRHSEVAAHGYLATRVVEGVMLALGAIALLAATSPTGDAAALEIARAVDHAAYTAGMLVLGVGSLLLCHVLLRARLVPPGLAVWGTVGYACVAVGMALEILGHGLGMVVWIPGGLFEVALGVLLVARGFPERTARADEPVAVTA